MDFPVNFGRVSNALSLWLSIEPPDVFLYVFLPPILVDSAVRLNFYIFRKVWMSPDGPAAARWLPDLLSSSQKLLAMLAVLTFSAGCCQSAARQTL